MDTMTLLEIITAITLIPIAYIMDYLFGDRVQKGKRNGQDNN